jgi:hypothetical protein
MALTRAQAIAWRLYLERIERIIGDQARAFESGFPSYRMEMVAPTQANLVAVQAALDAEAKDERQAVVHLALDPIRAACDAIDNSHTKSETVKQIRIRLQEAYEALHKLREAHRGADVESEPCDAKPA